MGFAAAVEGAGVALSALSTAKSISERKEGAKAQETLLRGRQTQERLAAVQQSNSEADSLEKTLSTAKAIAASRGIDLASGSFRNIQKSSFDAFDQDEKNRALNLSFRESALTSQIESEKRSASAGVFGDVLDFGSKFFEQSSLLDVNK